jgi:hypothetical protein
MKQTVLGTAAVLIWCVAASFAQQQPAEPPSRAQGDELPARTPPEVAPAHKVFVLTGCLKAGADATAAFKLTDASSTGQATPPGAAEAKAVGTSGQKVLYELLPVSGVEQGINADALKAHAGQRVEVTVRPMELVPAAAPNAASPAAQATKPIEPSPERFSVTAIKRVTGICS